MRVTPPPPPDRVAPARPARPVGPAARLIADLAAAPPPAGLADTPETRAERLAHDPAGLIAFLHGREQPGPAPDGRHAHVRSRIMAALFAPARQAYAESAEEGAASRRERVAVLRDLGSAAPAVTVAPPPPPPPGTAEPFTPSADDMAQSIDGDRERLPPFSAFRDLANWVPIHIETVNALPVLALLAALATGFVVWLLA